MGILNRLRRRIDGLLAERSLMPRVGDEPLHVRAELPGGAHGPVLRFEFQVETEGRHGGDRLHLRAHVQSNLASVLRPMISGGKPMSHHAALSAEGGALVGRPALSRIAEFGIRRAMANPMFKRLAEPLLRHDVNTWIELRASNEPLDGGAHELLPRNDKLDAMGIRPSPRKGTHVENWAGAAGLGHAQVSMLQMDKDSLPPALAERLGPEPFHLAAMVVNTVEEK